MQPSTRAGACGSADRPDSRAMHRSHHDRSMRSEPRSEPRGIRRIGHHVVRRPADRRGARVYAISRGFRRPVASRACHAPIHKLCTPSRAAGRRPPRPAWIAAWQHGAAFSAHVGTRCSAFPTLTWARFDSNASTPILAPRRCSPAEPAPAATGPGWGRFRDGCSGNDANRKPPVAGRIHGESD